VFFDCESRYDPSAPVQEHTFRLAVAVYVKLDTTLNVISRTVYHADIPENLWDFIVKIVNRTDTVTLIAHNAGFDLRVSRGLPILASRGWSAVKLHDDCGACYVCWKKGRRSIKLYDSARILRASIEALGRMLNLPKLPQPGVEDDDGKWREYCLRDVEILEQAVYAWIKFLQHHDLGNFCPTLASQAYHTYRYKFMREDLYSSRDPEIVEMEYEAYRGGRSEAFFLGEVRGKNLYKLDVNSMYPYVMLEYHHPVRPLWICEDVSVQKLRELSNSYWLIVDADIVTTEPFLAVRRNGKLLFPVGRIRAILCGEEVTYALAHNYVRAVRKAIIYRRAKPFDAYVKFFWNLRQKAKSEGDTVTEQNCKLLLNSLYGKFGERMRESYVEKVHDDVGWKYEILVDTATGRRGILKCLGNTTIATFTTGPAYFAVPAIAASVTAGARIYLWQLMLAAGLENVYYVDTDSLIVNEKGYHHLAQHISNTELGKLKLEKASDYLHIRNVKDYVMGEEIKLKGRGKVVEQIDDNTFRVERWQGLRGALRQGIIDKVIVVTRPWRRVTTYKKGVVKEEGRIYPLVFSDF